MFSRHLILVAQVLGKSTPCRRAKVSFAPASRISLSIPCAHMVPGMLQR